MQPSNLVGQGVRYPIVAGEEDPPVTNAITPLVDGFHAFLKWFEALLQNA